jgi:MOSC domain-containing protein YiiM
MGTLLSIQIGMPKFFPSSDQSRLASKPWLTGFFKTQTAETVSITIDGIDGDGQADLANHGGPDKAICVYPSEHFDFWRNFLNGDQLGGGGFGENFTTAGLLEETVCIGDRYRIGSAVVEVSQPRQPCWKLARRWDHKTLSVEVQRTGKTGWYFRVIESGEARAGESITPINGRSAPLGWSIANANEVMYGKTIPREKIRELASVPALSESWKNELNSRL